MTQTTCPLAVVTGASAGIGYELAKLCAENGHDLVVAADQAKITQAAESFREFGAERADRLIAAIGGRPVDVLMANAGHGLGHAFLDQDWSAARHVIDTNVTGTLYLIHRVGRGMRERGQGRILITGSIAGYEPGAYAAVYNASKAFIDSFAGALRIELEGSGVTVTNLLPGNISGALHAREAKPGSANE